MATFAEIQAAMTGFPRNLIWNDFRAVTTSPQPPRLGQASASYQLSGWSVQLVSGAYKVRGARVSVSLNPRGSWAMPAARSRTDLLRHEQGHYDITGLIGRDLIRGVLNLTANAAVVAVLPAAGRTASDHMRYVGRQFEAEITRLTQEAAALNARLNSDPVSHRDGLYDTQTNHGDNVAGQQAWNDRLSRVMAADVNFGLDLRRGRLL